MKVSDVYDYSYKITNDAGNNYNEIEDKKSYLKFRIYWVLQYTILSAKIRRFKYQRKEYIWKYREQSNIFWPIKNNTDKRKIKVRANPNYDYQADYKVYLLKAAAREMMEILELAKKKSWELKQKELQTVK